jgi:hypothetical protein
MFCNALMLAPAWIAKLAAVWRNSCGHSPAGAPESATARAQHRRRTLDRRSGPPREPTEPTPRTYLEPLIKQPFWRSLTINK